VALRRNILYPDRTALYCGLRQPEARVSGLSLECPLYMRRGRAVRLCLPAFGCGLALHGLLCSNFPLESLVSVSRSRDPASAFQSR
jgi:hypothetical protein